MAEFCAAAFPWIVVGILVAVACTAMSKSNEDKEVKAPDSLLQAIGSL